MAVPVVEASTSVGEALAGQIDLTKPTGTVQGDLLIALFYAEEGAVTPPSGWTAIETAVDSAAAANQTVSGHTYYKVAGASEPTTYTWDWPSTDYCGGVMLRISGFDSADVINVSRSRTRQAGGTGADENAASSNTISIPAITTDAADCLGVAVICSWAVTSGTATITDWTPVAAFDYGRVFTRSLTSATTYAQANTSITNETTSWVAITLAVNPAASSNATATPSAVAATSSVPAPTVSTSASVVASVVAAVASVLAPSVSTGSNATASPSTVAAVASVPAPTAGAGAGAAPSTVAATTAVPAPTVTTANFPGLYPTTVNGTTKQIEDQNGDPWFGVGDTAWSLVAELTDAEIETYFDEVAALGVNFVLFNAPEHFFATNGTANIDNEEPFTGTAFQSSLNDTYWDRVDLAVTYAGALGITCFICPQYLGFAGTEEGWDTELVAASNAQCTTYGEALATRYGSYPNIVWLIGHDQTPDATEMARSAAISDAIQAGTSHLVTVGANRNVDQTAAWAGSGVDWDFECVYEDGTDPGGDTASVWAGGACIYLEGDYEGTGAAIGDQTLREQMWHPWMEGASATLFGNSPRWHFETTGAFGGTGTWEQSLTGPYNDGSLHLSYLADFIAAVPGWGTTVPDTANTFLTAGTGASARFDTSIGIVYASGTGSITLDTTEMAGTANVKIRRYDPTTGSFTTVAASEAQNSSRSISYPGTNTNGDTDWVYIVELASSATATPSTVAAVVAVGSPTVGAGIGVTPPAVSAVAAVGSPTVAGGVSVAADVVAVTTSIPAPSITAGGNATATASTVAAVVAVPAPTVGAGAGVTPPTVAATVSIPAPAAASGVGVSPAVVSAVSAVPAPTLNFVQATTVSPSTVEVRTAVLPPPTISAGAIPAQIPRDATQAAYIAGLGKDDRRTEILRARDAAQVDSSVASLESNVTSLIGSSGTYTPTLTGMAVGTGGFAGATVRWVFHGGPNVGDYGTLTLNIFITYGTSGQTFPTNPTISLPSGFEFQDSNSNVPIGNCFLVDNSTGANSRAGTLFQGATAGVMRPLIDSRAAAPATLTTTTPFTWASSDGIYGTATIIAKRV